MTGLTVLWAADVESLVNKSTFEHYAQWQMRECRVKGAYKEERKIRFEAVACWQMTSSVNKLDIRRVVARMNTFVSYCIGLRDS